MCRLLGVVSRDAAPLTDTLSSDLEPFAALSSIHCDGWGMAYWDADDDLVVDKAPEAARGSERFWTAAKEASTDAAVLHLRRASEGMVPEERNTHPFAAGSVAFAHNGFFSPAARVEHEMLQRGGRPPQGDTDSERYFGMVLAAMHDESPVQALQSTAERITKLSDELVSLNALLLTQQALYAFSYWDETVPPRPEAGTATYELMFRVNDDAVTVASDGWEPLGPRWERISNGMVLEVSREDLRVRLHRS
ncbi:MAG: class II glutamine amidotransferase [Nocardioidaceae bacterium]